MPSTRSSSAGREPADHMSDRRSRSGAPRARPVAPVGDATALASAAPREGTSAPLGATPSAAGVNFSVFSRHATGVELLLFDTADDGHPARTIRLDPATDRTYHYWHVFVPDLRPGQLYGFRVDGPFDPARGFRFDREKLLLDPYGRAVVVPDGYRRGAGGPATAMKSVVVDPDGYDWEGDAPLRRSAARTVVYELHVRGFTRHPASGVTARKRGTYAGMIEKIPYLRDLGVTAVELLPVFQFDPQAAPTGVNYWGYAPVSFFAPHQPYSARRDALGPVDEFRDLVKAMHRAGLEVILDVVYNHTAEGDETCPTVCLRGFDNKAYYILQRDRAHYADYTGCGNTLNANHAVVRRMIVDSLRYWVEVMHVDGFRFDLASILTRDESGQPMPNAPVLWDIESDPVLAGTKLFAEAWDAAGLYDVGRFVGDSWKEWNGRFRDDVRDFFRAGHGSVRRFADRLVGSPELYGHKEREPEQSVNFVTCHDGFTLNDLVSYDRKHNEANGEGNRDGTDDNRSWNCGVEGPTEDPAVERLRNRQVKNFLTTTLLSVGLPMITMGDEVRRTQRGNNNAYSHDDESTWFDWTLLAKHADVHRFVSLLNARRVRRSVEHERRRLTLVELIAGANKAWHGVELDRPDWTDDSHSIALGVELRKGLFAHLVFNAYWGPLTFALPAVPAGTWHRWIDTALDAPDDIVPWDDAPPVDPGHYAVHPRSVVVLYADAAPRRRRKPMDTLADGVSR
jgi:glycogen operon protein